MSFLFSISSFAQVENQGCPDKIIYHPRVFSPVFYDNLYEDVTNDKNTDIIDQAKKHWKKVGLTSQRRGHPEFLRKQIMTILKIQKKKMKKILWSIRTLVK